MKTPINNIVHIIIPVLDLAKAREFYSTIFTWEFAEPTKYNINFKIAEDDFLSGSLNKQDNITRSDGIWFFVYVDDLQTTKDLVNKMGGSIVDTGYSVEAYPGTMAICQDPFGNRIGLWCDEE